MSQTETPSPDAWQRVAAAIRSRRNTLGLTQEAAAAAGDGASPVIWRLIENARQDAYKPRTLAAVCRALGWTTDSIDRILAGDQPVLADQPAGGRLEDLEGQISLLRGEVARLARVVRQQGEQLAALTDAVTAQASERSSRRA